MNTGFRSDRIPENNDIPCQLNCGNNTAHRTKQVALRTTFQFNGSRSDRRHFSRSDHHATLWVRVADPALKTGLNRTL